MELNVDWPNVTTVAELAIALAVGVVSFMQWRLSHRVEKLRQSERREDEAAALDAAYGAVWAEWFRMWSVSERWNRLDLVEQARWGVLSADEILPRDWSAASLHLGRLVILPATLGGMAFTLASDLALLLQQFIADARALNEEIEQRPEDADGLEAQFLPQLRSREPKIRKLAAECANLFQDALEHSPRAKVGRSMKLNEDLRSQSARDARGKLEAMAGHGPAAAASKAAIGTRGTGAT